MDAVMRRSLPAVFIALLVAMSFVAPATAAKEKATVHKPPYKKGPSGGDEFNYVHADPQTGEMIVGRLFPGFSPVVGCEPEPSGGWAMFRLPHHVTDTVSKVTVNFEGSLDPYGWVSVVVRNGRGESIGLDKFQGPHAGAGKVTVPLFASPERGSHIEVEFGAQLGDACPQVGWAVLSFPSVAIK